METSFATQISGYEELKKMFTRPKILVVDDDPICLTLIQAYLEPAGYQVVMARHGLQAWDLLTKSSHNFSAVLADRVMPYMNGIELTRNVRSQPAFNHLPVIMLTGYTEREEQVTAVKEGVYDYLIKPIEQELLLMVIKRALNA